MIDVRHFAAGVHHPLTQDPKGVVGNLGRQLPPDDHSHVPPAIPQPLLREAAVAKEIDTELDVTGKDSFVKCRERPEVVAEVLDRVSTSTLSQLRQLGLLVIHRPRGHDGQKLCQFDENPRRGALLRILLTHRTVTARRAFAQAQPPSGRRRRTQKRQPVATAPASG